MAVTHALPEGDAIPREPASGHAPLTAVEDAVHEDHAPALPDEPPRSVIPPAFYRDDDPPEPPDDDPHWQEFPLFDAMKGGRLIVVSVVLGVLFVSLMHMMVLLTL